VEDELTSRALQDQVLAANRRFYDAFEALDLDAIEACWETSGRAACLHPGGPWMRGWDEVRDGWETILAHTNYIEFEIVEPRVELVDPMAWVTCVERITTAADGGQSVAEVAATNLWVLDGAGWHLVLHHASPVVRPAPLES
jgi:ketosteroid isomerase-like protein